MESIKLFINGKSYTAKCSPNTRLSTYLRDHAGLMGTKVMCGEGGCGSCIVTVTRLHPVTGDQVIETVNSCLCPLHSVAGCHITTVEGLGDQRNGYHSIQKNIAAYNGSQCGYCTPGMVMNMYGFFSKHTCPSESEVEGAFDGSLCRCTGYRAILDSAKAFVKGKGKHDTIDIEEIHKFKCPMISEGTIAGSADESKVPLHIYENKKWYSPRNMGELAEVMVSDGNKMKVKLVCGNTSAGMYKNEPESDVYVNLKNVKELNQFKINDKEITVGACCSIEEIISKLKQVAEPANGKPNPKFTYLKNTLIPYMMKIGGTAIRSVGSWAGNLMVAHRSKGFPSDLLTALEALQAKIQIADGNDLSQIGQVVPSEFLKTDMSGKLILNLSIPGIDKSSERFQAYKVMPRAASSLAIINAAFYAKLENRGDNCVIQTIRIAFGGLSSKFLRAIRTENNLTGKMVSQDSFKDACDCLCKELEVEKYNDVMTEKQYRVDLARNLLFKFLRDSCNTGPNGENFYTNMPEERPASSAELHFEGNKEKYPYCQPIPKLESLLQTSGEAQYVDDIPRYSNEIHMVLVLSQQANANIKNIDYSKALLVPGVHSIITAANMTAMNVYGDEGDNLPLLAKEQVKYAGQPIAAVLADTETSARKGSKEIVVTYMDIQIPILHIEDAIVKNYYHKDHPEIPNELKVGEAEAQMPKCEKVVEGQAQTKSAYHFYIENQACLCVPYDDMMDIFITTQHKDVVQSNICRVLGKPAASINVKVLRLGGGFGGKNTVTGLIGGLCAVAASTVNRPVRCVLSLEESMKMTMKRFPTLAKYKVGVAKSGRIESIIMDMYVDFGCFPQDLSYIMSNGAMHIMDNCYKIPHWKIKNYAVKTDQAPTGPMRAPLQLPYAFIMESLMEDVARALHKNPVYFKESHLLTSKDFTLVGDPYTDLNITEVWDKFKVSASLETRLKEVDQYNKTQKFRKRGLAVTPSKFFFSYFMPATYNVYVSVFATDGTVAMTTGAIEMGQGINTKVVQVAAYVLGIDMEYIKVHSSTSLTSPNNAGTYGSQGSENVCRSVLETCKLLMKKMEPVKKKNPELSWKELVKLCDLSGVDLSASYRHTSIENQQGSYSYSICAATAVEVEVDILTGQNTVNRLDGLFDLGQSANPIIDIGQIEGALMMGLGFFRSELEVYDKETGMILNPNTWGYKPPTALDIPQRMNIELLKNSHNEYGVMPSKAVGEPPILGSSAVMFAIRRAIESYRKDKGNEKHFDLDQPATVEVIQQLCDVTLDDLLQELPK